MNHSTSSDSQQPPQIQQTRRRFALLIGAGVLVAAVLLLVLFNIDAPPQSTQSSQTQRNLVELIPPDRLNAADVTGTPNQPGRSLQDLGTENTWIQTTRDGKLAQQYRFASHDPNPEGLPPGWSKVNQPEIQIYFSDDRVMTLRSETAMLRVQGETLESGRMTGHVTIRLYRTEPNQHFDPDAAAPTMECLTDEAFYDNIQGEVRCDGSVDVQTVTAHLPGEQLRVQINEVENRIEWLRLETVGEVRLTSITEPAPSASSPKNAVDVRLVANRRNRSQAERQRKYDAPTSDSFYRLTLRKNVHVQQGDSSAGWTAGGDDLHVIFSLESKSLGKSLAGGFNRDDAVELSSSELDRTAAPIDMTTLGLSMVIAATPDTAPAGLFQPSDDDITITCADGLIMTPLTEVQEFPESTEDARIELIGTPLRLRSYADAADIVGQAMVFHTQRERVEIHGSSEFPLTIQSPQLQGEGETFWLNRLEQTAGFDGEGWLVMRQPVEEPASEQLKDVRIQWQSNVSMTFDKSRTKSNRQDSMGSLRRAAFAGNVEVTTDEVFLRADSMIVQLPADDESIPASSRRQRLDSILAEGSVRALSLTDQGTLACDSLDVRFAHAADGRTLPSHMTAVGQVAAVDSDHQTVWSDRLVIEFMSPEESGAVATAAAAESAADTGTARVKSLLAEPNVQVLLADGARAFADRLEADAGADLVTLTGSDVMILNDRAAIYRGTRMELRTTDRTAHWAGGGQFAYFTTSITPDDGVRMTKPLIEHIITNDNPVQIRASWTESMQFDGEANDGAGSLRLTGQIQAESTPSALEYNTLSSHALTMHFARPADAALAAPPDEASTADALSQGDRELKLFIAEGEAKLETRAWLFEDHADTPRVFYLAGPHITYDNQTLESAVQGAGELLVRDEQVVQEQDQERSADGSIPFSGKGTTLFRWSDHLYMKQSAGAMYDIEMIGSVQVRHLALDKSISTMTGRELHATVERIGAAEPAQQGNASLDLGGSMELRRLRGVGGMLIRTAIREVDCEEFQYEYATGIADISALPGRTVMVKTAGNPNPLRATRVIWNIPEDKINATNVRGSGPR